MYSQYGTDGIIEAVISATGQSTGKFIEIGCGTGIESNCAHLAVSRGWSGCVVDADRRNVRVADGFFKQQLGSQNRVRPIQAFVTSENLNSLLTDWRGEVDVLSIDVDGNDFWLWEAMTEVSPRLVIIEYNFRYGRIASMTVSYRPDFDRFQLHESGRFYGASLTAFAKLAGKKGYVLLGCESSGVNAFFLRSDLVRPPLVTLDPEQAFAPYWNLEPAWDDTLASSYLREIDTLGISCVSV